MRKKASVAAADTYIPSCGAGDEDDEMEDGCKDCKEDTVEEARVGSR